MKRKAVVTLAAALAVAAPIALTLAPGAAFAQSDARYQPAGVLSLSAQAHSPVWTHNPVRIHGAVRNRSAAQMQERMQGRSRAQALACGRRCCCSSCAARWCCLQQYP